MITTAHNSYVVAQDLLKTSLNMLGDLYFAGHRILKVEEQDNDVVITTETGKKKFKPWKAVSIERR